MHPATPCCTLPPYSIPKDLRWGLTLQRQREGIAAHMDCAKASATIPHGKSMKGNQLLAGGEAGSETVVGTKSLIISLA